MKCPCHPKPCSQALSAKDGESVATAGARSCHPCIESFTLKYLLVIGLELVCGFCVN